MRRPWLLIAALAGLSGVALGAFGAHGLKGHLDEHFLEVYKTAVSYQMWHALALAITAMLPPQPLLLWAGRAFTAGLLLFCGSLYLLALSGAGWLGMVTPFGGLAFLSGWGLLALWAWRDRAHDNDN